MQNEERINVLETQVRTLKRIVCFVGCLFAVFMFAGCSTSSQHMMVDEDFVPASFSAVAIKNPDSRIIAEQVGWIELTLAEVFKGLGYKIIGENEVADYPSNSVLLVRYSGTSNWDSRYKQKCNLMVIVENATTGKTVCTAEGKYNGGGSSFVKDAEIEAKEILVTQIREAFSQN